MILLVALTPLTFLQIVLYSHLFTEFCIPFEPSRPCPFPTRFSMGFPAEINLISELVIGHCHFTDLSIIIFCDFQRVCRNAILVDRFQCRYKPILNFFTGFSVLHWNPDKAFFKFSNLHFTSPTFLLYSCL